MAINYIDIIFAEAQEIDAFSKSPSSIIGPGDTMDLSSAADATIFHGEAEMAVVIGKDARCVTEADAMDYVFGFVNFIDGSARSLGTQHNVFYQSKSRRTFAPIGPYLVTADEFGDPYNKQVRLWNNGELKQDYLTSTMAHRIPECLAFITAKHDLGPGDIVSLGTNHAGLHPFMDGDLVELETEGLGRLQINVRDALNRKWDRSDPFGSALEA
jgi:2-keto-4-pentenoate hydratase/2-oxohepta-3-ene-1,7-dioic acid hydratase in catechol pathway